MAKFSSTSSNQRLKASALNAPDRLVKKLSHQSRREVAEKSTVDIPIKDFLEFLHTAYQVNQAIEGVPFSLPQNAVVNWDRLTCSNLCFITSRLGDTHENSNTKKCGVLAMSCEDAQKIEKIMKVKLNEILQEGLLDSMIPYMLPKNINQPVIKKPITSVDPPKSELDKSSRIINGPNQITCVKEKISLRRKSCSNTDSLKCSKGDAEVEIHVCDEIRNVKKKFKCPQKLLVSKMGYFSEVTSGQKLEDMDISVHCDLNIFEWLMKWVQRENLPEENWPHLDTSNIVSILVSASFLRMDPLEIDCLNFFYLNANDVLKSSSNLSCLNDCIISKLANHFSNSDVEALVDRKDKIQTQLYCKLIASLMDGQPNVKKGHFYKLSSLYKCNKCEKLIMKEVQSRVLCTAQNMRMDRMGTLHASHSRDPLWDLNEYIRSLRSVLGSWRLVYWHLWAECHILICSLCRIPFTLVNITDCAHHAESALFVSVGGRPPKGIMFPIGHYPCCGSRAYRFEPLPSRTGCQFIDHQPELYCKNDLEIWQLFLKYRHLIVGETENSKSLGKFIQQPRIKDGVGKPECPSMAVRSCCHGNLPWWMGLHLAPRRSPHGLLSSIWDLYRHANQQMSQLGSEDGRCSEYRDQRKRQISMEEERLSGSSSVGDSSWSSETSSGDEGGWEEEDFAGHWIKEDTKYQCVSAGRDWTIKKAHYLNSSGSSIGFQPRKGRWLSRLSTRTNQDNQRDLEEKAMGWASIILARRTCVGNLQKPRPIPMGGIYVRLEHDWRGLNGVNVHLKGVHPNNKHRTKLGR